ncbi:MAG TPA: ferritin-like domain-containing protein [Myxococcales bacterium]|jgi:bacterioferritin (cytochrome b1)|nr:ferritin-like domain-containing protein [Myxococcales bacterium]
MLLSREEMTFDWSGARLDPVRDRAVLGWVMNQFLYGEVSGIQCGHWLYAAPDLDAARFFARQAVEEFQHVDNFLRILEILGEKPAPAHRLVRFLGTGMMPSTFEEHVCLEMALGEGFVLVSLYALIDTLDQAEIREILQRAVKQEERHVDFGERRTAAAIRGRPALRRKLLGLSLVSMWAVRRLGRFLERKLPADHPVLHRLPEFLDFTVDCGELRLRRIGILDAPLERVSAARKASAVLEAYAWSLATLPLRLLPRRRLTDTYLHDPVVARAEEERERRDGSLHIVR